MRKIDINFINALICIDGRNGYYIINKLINNYGNKIYDEIQFQLYCTVLEKFQLNIMIFSQIIEGYFFGYSGLKANLRSSIEAFLDLLNVSREEDYSLIMKVGSGIEISNLEKDKYMQLMDKHNLNGAFVSFETKNIIAKRNGLMNYFYEDLKSIYDSYSDAVHSGIFDRSADKITELETKKLLILNIRLLQYSLTELAAYYSKKLNKDSEFILEGSFILSQINGEINQLINTLSTQFIFKDAYMPDYSQRNFFG